MDKNFLIEKSKNIRMNLLKAIYKAGSGHPGGSLSAVDILTYLYFEEMNVNPQNPNMEGRDKFVLSKGHGAPALYATLGEMGYYDVEDMMELRKIGGKFQGHPCRDKVSGIEMSTGSLGQGISVATGMAMANKMDNSKGRVFVLMGDGELQEGIVWEAVMSASHYKLDNLVAVVDWNGLQIDGKNDDVMTVKPIDEKFKAFGWDVQVVSGHDFEQLKSAFDKAKSSEKPFVIIAQTHKGKGVSFMEDNAGWHGKAPNESELARALNEIGGQSNGR